MDYRSTIKPSDMSDKIKIAIAWWNTLSSMKQNSLCMFYFKGRKSDSLTGREIEETHKKYFIKS